MILVPLNDEPPVVLNKAVIFFGRSQECDVVLSHSRKVSRKHCCIAQIDSLYLVRDLGSTNGVTVNHKKADPELAINVGDEVWIGDVGFRMVPGDQKGKPVAAAPLPPVKIKQSRQEATDKDVPIPIPEEDQDLIIEESVQQKILDNDDLDTFE